MGFTPLKIKINSKGYPLPSSINYNQSRIIDLDTDVMSANRLAAFFDDSLISEQYKILRTQILYATKKGNLNSLLVTSVGENEGKTLTSANLAISLARELEHTVLLVDADLRSPSVHRLFGINPKAGLSDYLISQKPLSEILINPGINKLTILPGRHNLSNSAEIIGSPEMKKLINEMKNRYADRYIIFDSPPVINYADTLILSHYVDGVILVIEYGKTKADLIEKTIHLLKNVNVIGTVLNKAPVTPKSWYF